MATENALRRAFDVFDEDGSGYLTKDEFQAILLRQAGGSNLSDSDAAEVLAAMDSDGDGKVSLEELIENWSAQALVSVDVVQEEVQFANVDNASIFAVHGEGSGRCYDIVDIDVDCMHRRVPAYKIYDDPLANGGRPPHMLEVGDTCAVDVVDKYAMRRAGVSMPEDGWESLYAKSAADKLQITVMGVDGGTDAGPYEALIAEVRATNSVKPDDERDGIAEAEAVLAILKEAKEAGVEKMAASAGEPALSIDGWIRDVESNIQIQREVAAI